MHMLLADIFFPKRCLGCAREGTHCCEDCLSVLSLARTPSPLPPSSSLAGLFCATSWEDKLVQRLVHCFKYPPFLHDLAKPLACLIVSHFALSNNVIYPLDVIIPVPLHKRRLRWRGYNHAEELANQLGYAFSVPVAANALVKTKNTAPQANLNKEQRLQNTKGVFEISDQAQVKDKTILLVDDVFTTGATMEECSRVLKEAGAARVYGVAVARD